MTISAAQYRDLLRAALPSAVDAAAEPPDLQTLFTPRSHRSALDSDATVVRGGRGVGKTVWFSALQHQELRALAADRYELRLLRSVQTVPGYGESLASDQYPGPRVLAALLAAGFTPPEIWLTVLCIALGAAELQSHDGWRAWVRWVREHPDAVERALVEADSRAAGENRTTLVLFDALDRMSPDAARTQQLVQGILELALELRTRTRRVRAKVFIRPDMLVDDVLGFVDASKLTATAADLTWTPTDLFGLLFHRMGNCEEKHLAERFRAETGAWQESTPERFTPPRELVGDQDRQRALFESLAGPFMGTDHRKGRPYTWLPNHLVDGLGQVSPRSFLSALRHATEVTEGEHAGHGYALHWDGIRRGVQHASQTRVQEISEDLPWVRDALAPLESMQVPVAEGDVLDRWVEEGLSERLASRSSPEADLDEEVRTGPRSAGGPGLVGELLEIGVMTRRTDGRLDVPDIYRVAFRIGRKGGVPRLTR